MNRKEIYTELYNLAKPSLEKNPKDRNYKDRYFIWELEKFCNPNCESYDEGEEVEIYDGNKLVKNEIKDGFDEDFPEWFRNLGKDFGKEAILDGEKVTFVGVSYTYLDYYYIFKTKDNKKVYDTCVDKLNLIEV